MVPSPEAVTAGSGGLWLSTVAYGGGLRTTHLHGGLHGGLAVPDAAAQLGEAALQGLRQAALPQVQQLHHLRRLRRRRLQLLLQGRHRQGVQEVLSGNTWKQVVWCAEKQGNLLVKGAQVEQKDALPHMPLPHLPDTSAACCYRE